MACISKDTVKFVAKLSRLRFNDEELESITNQLSRIVNLTEELAQIDCDGVEPLVSFDDIDLTIRKDEVNQQVLLEELLKNTPAQFADIAKNVKCFVVPKAVE